MIRLPPRSTRTDTPSPYTPLFRRRRASAAPTARSPRWRREGAMTMSEVDRTVLAGNAAIERSRERRRPIGTKSLALRRQHLFRKIGRMFMAGGAGLIAAARLERQSAV